MVSRAEKRARQTRLDEVAALLLESEQADDIARLFPWKRQLLALLQKNGITKSDDLSRRDVQELVKSGLGAQVAEGQGFRDLILVNKDVESSPRIKFVDEQASDQNVMDRRFQEINVLLNGEEDRDVMIGELEKFQNLYREALRLKQLANNPAERDALYARLRANPDLRHDLDKKEHMEGAPATDDDIVNVVDKIVAEILPKVNLNPVQMRLLETAHAHGIRSSADLYKPQNALWVMRGMPDTFLETQVGLKPSQSFSVLEHGSTQAEIQKTLDNMTVQRLSPLFTDCFNRVETGSNVRPYDVEIVALMKMNGVMSAAELNGETGRNVMLNADTLFKELKAGYNGEHNPTSDLDVRGFPKIARSGDLNLALDVYAQTGKVPSRAEMRVMQAKSVMDKVALGEPLQDWEQALFIGLTKEGVRSVADVEKKRSAVENGLKGNFKKGAPQSFSDLKLSDLQPRDAQVLHNFVVSADNAVRPDVLTDDRLRARPNGTTFAAMQFAGDVENALHDFQSGQKLTHLQEELVAAAAMHGYTKFQDVVMFNNTMRGAMFSDLDLRDRISNGHDLITGDVLENKELDEQGFIVGKNYDAGMKEYILKLREAQKMPAGQRKLPFTPFKQTERAANYQKFAQTLLEAGQKVSYQPFAKKKDLENARLEEAQELLEKVKNPAYRTKDYEDHLLAALADAGITKASDLKSRANKNKVKAGLGLADLGNRSFIQYFYNDKQIYDKGLEDETVTYQRYMEATMILEKFKDHDYLMEQLNNMKAAYYASEALRKGENLTPEEKAQYEADLQLWPEFNDREPAKRSEKLLAAIEAQIPLAIPTPVEHLIYESLAAHGIKTAEDLDNPQNDLWVRRGMTGSFIDKQVHLKPDQSYADLNYGLSQEEIARSKARKIEEAIEKNLKESFDRAANNTLSASDKERLAVLAAYGITNVEQLQSAEFKAIVAQKQLDLVNEGATAYKGDGSAMKVDANGEPVVAGRADDVARMMKAYKETGRFPTKQEVRYAQALDVLNKVAQGKETQEWERALYAGLAHKGIASAADITPELKTQIENGLSDAFGKPLARGFNTIGYKDLSEQAADKLRGFVIETKKTNAPNSVEVMRDFAKAMERVDLYERRVEQPMMRAAQNRANAAQPQQRAGNAPLKRDDGGR